MISAASQQKIYFQQNVKVVPENYVVFECEDDQPMGQIRINLLNSKTKDKDKQCPSFQFELMVTNKNNYKVSNAKGMLSNQKRTALIRIYIKNTQNLQKCLSDKFRLRIKDTKRKCHIDYKLKVLIQKQVSNSKLDQINSNSTQTMTKPGISIYTNPSILTSTVSNDLKSIFYMGQSLILMRQNNKSHISSINASQLASTKQNFDDSTHSLSKKKKQLQAIQESLGKQRARQKFCLFWIVFVFIFSILGGFCFKKLSNKEMWTDFIRNNISQAHQYF